MPGRASPTVTIVAMLSIALLALAAWRVAADDPEPTVTAVTVDPGGRPSATGPPQVSAGEQARDPAQARESAPGGQDSGGIAADTGDPASAAVGEPAVPGSGAAPTAASAPASRGAPLALDRPADAYPLVRVRRGQRVEVRTEPAGGEVVERAGRRTEFRSPTVFSVIRESGKWAGVATPDLPNNQLGWIKLDGRRLKAGWTRVSIEIDLSQRRAELRESGKPVRSFAVTIGMPGSDTPTGRFAVTDTLRGNLNPAYGCCAVALSATQPNVPSGWLGGRRIAIHGTSGPLGIAASHGCVRAADVDVSELIDRVPLGAPVFIRA